MGDLVYNSHGKEYAVPRERVFSIYDLGRGDHIVFHRYAGLYWHHAIVEYVDYENYEIDVIHYSKTSGGLGIVRGTYQFDQQDVYLMKHRWCLDHDAVVGNAISMLGEYGYHPIANNCEHFAMWCKTGISSSDQVDKAGEMIVSNELKQFAPKAGQKLVERGVRQGARKAFTWTASKAAGRAGHAFVQKGAREATNQVLTQSTSTAGQAASQTSTAAGGVAIGAVIEGISVMYDIDRAHNDMRDGIISRRQFEDVAAKRVITGTTNVGGSVAGMAIGQALCPVPVVGGVIGAIAGGVLGSMFGNTLVNL